MIFTNGQRSFHVSLNSFTRVRDGIVKRPGLTVPEYAELTEVASSTINVLITADEVLWRMACQGKIAISTRGTKPDWFYDVTQPDLVPVRATMRPRQTRLAHGIKHPYAARKVDELIEMTGGVGRVLSPRQRHTTKQAMIRRVIDLGLQAEAAMIAFDRLAVKFKRGGKNAAAMTQPVRITA